MAIVTFVSKWVLHRALWISLDLESIRPYCISHCVDSIMLTGKPQVSDRCGFRLAFEHNNVHTVRNAVMDSTDPNSDKIQ